MEALTSAAIARLSPAERIALIARLWDSLDHDSVPLSEPQRAEPERRRP